MSRLNLVTSQPLGRRSKCCSFTALTRCFYMAIKVFYGVAPETYLAVSHLFCKISNYGTHFTAAWAKACILPHTNPIAD